MRVHGVQVRVGDKVRIAEDLRDVPAEAKSDGQEAVFLGLGFRHTGRLYRGSRAEVLPLNPKFRLSDGSVIWGVECFWVPLPIALEVEARVHDAKG